MRRSSERPKQPRKRSAILCFNMAAHIMQCKALSLYSFLWTTLLCTFSLFHLKCQFTAGSVLSAQPLLHVCWGIYFILFLLCDLLISTFLLFYLFSFVFFHRYVPIIPTFVSVSQPSQLYFSITPFSLHLSLFLQPGLASFSHRQLNWAFCLRQGPH